MRHEDPTPTRWYALTVLRSRRDPLHRQRAVLRSSAVDPPLRIGVEFRVLAALHRLGVPAVVPVERVQRRVSRRCRRRVTESRPMLPGIVFCAEPPCRWGRVMGLREVSGVLGREGRPARLCRRDVAWVMARSDRPAHRPEVSPGDMVEVREGALAGWVVEVMAVHGGRVSVACGLFGGLEAQVSLDALRAA